MADPLVVLGAGLAGLSTAYHAKKAGRPYLLFEKNERAGGLVRSQRVNGFSFDYTGHLLHMREARTRALVLDELALKEDFAPVSRDAWVYSHGRYTRAPFQANLFGLPPAVLRECLEGALRAQGALPQSKRPAGASKGKTKGKGGFQSFEDFNLGYFGEGIYRHFMEPYNTKLWGVHPSEMSTEFMGRFVPKPSLERMFEGALFDQAKPMGYNADFIYPKRVGIEILSRAFAERVEVRASLAALAVDPRRRSVTLSDGSVHRYARLVTTLPLPRLVAILKDAPAEVKRAAARLRASSVLNVNLGIAGRDVSSKQWIYVPEPHLPFYRVGFYHNFSKAMVPRGGSSVYAEMSYSPQRPIDKAAAPARVKAGLRSMGILRAGDRIAAEWVADIEDAYVVYDAQRTESVESIQSWLRARDIVSTGRWGRWEYAAMEDAIWQGAEAAR
ncbi:MAG TPA: FAD-dependent oxidoreductase [bacterium]|jgi:protoporphyrinogen oxidase|nr:FAD-dependent oxidoreductase [bacterium]